MRKKVTIEARTFKKQVEGLPLLLEAYPQYKVYNIQNHLKTPPPNSICIFCHVPRMYYGKTIKIPFLNRKSIDKTIFYDWNGDRGYLIYGKKSKNILFTTNDGLVVGLYIKNRKTLVLMDITHYNLPRLLKMANKILTFTLEALKKEGIDDTIFYKKQERIRLQSIGADPEFELSDSDNELIRARDIYDSISNPIGCDGSGAQLELRPQAGNITTVIKSLQNLLSQVKKDGYNVGLNNYYSCGGHIHFGYGQHITPGKGFLEVLDDFLGIPTRDLIYREGYGKLSDYEVKPWGFEYRTPSAAIFSNKKIAHISLKIAYLIGSKVGKTIEYNNPPTKEDYIKLGLTEKQADYFLNFIHTFSKSVPSVYGGWKIKPNDILIRFRDEWKDEVKTKVKESIKKIRVKEPVFLILFGLSQERGDVNTIPIEGYAVIKHPFQDLTVIGVARKIRFGEDVDTFIKGLTKYIREQILRKKKS